MNEACESVGGETPAVNDDLDSAETLQRKKDAKNAKRRAWRKVSNPKFKAEVDAYHRKNREKINAQRNKRRKENWDSCIQKEREYKSKNKDLIAQKLRQWREDNRESLRKKKQAYHFKNRDQILKKQKAYREANPESIAASKKRIYEANKPRILAKCKIYYQQVGRHKSLEQGRNWRNKNRERWRKTSREYAKQRKKTDVLFALKSLCMVRLHHAIVQKSFRKNGRTMELLGCDAPTLKAHIEAQFSEGMTWENRGRNGWHVDHITPLSSAKTEGELAALFHYTNLQPLWWKENLAKSDKMPPA